MLCPEIEKILNKRHIPALHLNPRATFNFLSKIEENGAYFVLVKEDLIPLLGSNVEEPWLQSWKFQIHTINGKHIAAILIQALWRGYLVNDTSFYR